MDQANSSLGRGMGYSWDIHGVFTGYSRGIHGVFMGYTYVSVMYRLCIGYVSVMCRLCDGAYGQRGGVNKEDNIDNSSYLAFARTIITVVPTLCHGEGIYLSTIKTT